MFENFTKHLDSFLEQGIPGYDCVVYHKGKEVYRHFNGYSDLENGIKMNGKELYNIYSCSKGITCTAALQLYEKGAFRLTDDLADYLPEFRNMMVHREDGSITPAKNSIKIENLFTMSAGMDYNCHSDEVMQAYKDTNGRCQTREVMPYLASRPLWFEPGKRWSYSLCHDVIGALVEVLSGLTLGEYAKEHIFDPVGMIDTAYIPTEEQKQRLCMQYRYDAETGKFNPVGSGIQNNYRFGYAYESGGAGCVSTVEDYIRFIEALRQDGVLLQRSTLDLMSTNRLNEHQRKGFAETLPEYGYGLGVRCQLTVNSPITDFGWGGAAGAHLSLDRTKDLTVYYAQSVLNSPNGERRKITRWVEEDLFGATAQNTNAEKKTTLY